MADRPVRALRSALGRLRRAGREPDQDAPGRFVSVAGRRIHLMTEGDPRSGVCVVLESALAAPCTEWAMVSAGLRDRATVLAYDRAGNGWSDPGRTSMPDTLNRLDAVLDAVLEPAPRGVGLVLVGHSVGGLVAMAAAARRPDRAVGLVLVDSSHPDQFRRSAAQRDGLSEVAHAMATTRRRARRGQIEESATFGAVAQLPDAVREPTLRRLRRPEPWAGAVAELAAVVPGWVDAARAAALPAGLAVGVVTAGEQARVDPVHAQLQEELADRAGPTRHTVVAGATHDAVVMSQDGADAVIETCRWVLDTAAAATAATAREGHTS